MVMVGELTFKISKLGQVCIYEVVFPKYLVCASSPKLANKFKTDEIYSFQLTLW